MQIDEDKYSALLKRVLSGIAYEDFRIEPEWVGARRLNLHAHVSNNDIGLILGKKATLIKAIQSLFQLIGTNARLDTLYVCVYSPLTRKGKDTGERKMPKKDFNQDVLLDLVRDLVGETGHALAHLSMKPVGKSTGIDIQPALPEEVSGPLHIITEAYGKSYGQRIGLNL